MVVPWRSSVYVCKQLDAMYSSGGTDPRGPDGSAPESHGAILSSCLVRKGWDERSTPSDQEVFLSQECQLYKWQ